LIAVHWEIAKASLASCILSKAGRIKATLTTKPSIVLIDAQNNKFLIALYLGGLGGMAPAVFASTSMSCDAGVESLPGFRIRKGIAGLPVVLLAVAVGSIPPSHENLGSIREAKVAF